MAGVGRGCRKEGLGLQLLSGVSNGEEEGLMGRERSSEAVSD